MDNLTILKFTLQCLQIGESQNLFFNYSGKNIGFSDGWTWKKTLSFGRGFRYLNMQLISDVLSCFVVVTR